MLAIVEIPGNPGPARWKVMNYYVGTKKAAPVFFFLTTWNRGSMTTLNSLPTPSSPTKIGMYPKFGPKYIAGNYLLYLLVSSRSSPLPQNLPYLTSKCLHASNVDRVSTCTSAPESKEVLLT